MEPVRKRGNGTWDNSQSRWELKSKSIRKSPRQLAAFFGEPVPNTKGGSEPFWRRYLEIVRSQNDAVRRKESAHQDRLASLDTIIESLEQEGRDATVFIAERDRVIALPHWDIDTPDVPVSHPDTVPKLNALGLSTDELAIDIFNPKPKTTHQPTFRTEATTYIATKSTHEQLNTRRALDPLLAVCGDMPVQDFSISSYRRYLDALKAMDSWGATTKAKHQERVHGFLRGIAVDYNLALPFVGNRRYTLHVPEGRKEQYTMEQVHIALEEAKGIDRLSLLLGLNCGFYWGDITELSPDHIVNGHISKVRAKERWRQKQVKPSWLLWDETREVLQFGLTKKALEASWLRFTTRYSLPSHKALRKTSIQLLCDKVSAEAGRLFKGEALSGVIGRNYVRDYTPEQVHRLDDALITLHSQYWSPLT